jgi:peptidoglycan/LPS O-acetylase OafA/YrhL
MDPLQVFLVAAALVLAVGGGVMLYRGSRDPNTSARGPYVPLAMMAIGLMVAYRVYSDFDALEPIDLLIMFLFVFGLISLLGLQFFVVDKNRRGR